MSGMVQLLGVWVSPQGELGILMELMSEDLTRHIDKAEYCWGPEALQIAIDVAKGLHHLHKQRCVHRDLKPANVLLATGADGRYALASSTGISACMA